VGDFREVEWFVENNSRMGVASERRDDGLSGSLLP
jgi:hypothetical protein